MSTYGCQFKWIHSSKLYRNTLTPGDNHKNFTRSARTIQPNLYVINLMYFQPRYLENWDMYFPEGVQNEFGYFEGPSFSLTRDQEIIYSGKDKWMLIETRFTLFSAWTRRVIPGMPCHIILTKTKKERRKSKQGHTGCQLISLFQRLSFCSWF